MNIIIEKQVAVSYMMGVLEDEDNYSTPKQVLADTHITGNISIVTDPDVSPTVTTSVLTQAKIGLLATLEKN